MTAQLELERILDDFLAEGADELSDHVLDAALRDTKHIHQRRAWRVSWRYSDMPTPLRLLAAAAILATAMGGAFILGGTLNRQPPPEPAPDPNPSALDSRAEEIGLNRGGDWTATRAAVFGSVAGEYRLLLDEDQTIIARGPDDHEILIGTLGGNPPEGQVILGPTQSCTGEGSYAAAFSEDNRKLTLALVNDDCADRTALLKGEWLRQSILHPLVPGQRYTIDLDPRVSFVMPAAFRFDNGNPSDVHVPTGGQVNELFVDAENYLVQVWTAEEVPGDRCDWNVAARPTPGTLDEFVEWNQDSTGVAVSDPVEATVAGHPAVYVDVGGTDDCPNGAVRSDCGCVPGLNLTDVDGTLFERIWAVDVGGQIVIVLFHDDNPPWQPLTPERLAVAQEFIDSIQFE
jgi:hypothetical protein